MKKISVFLSIIFILSIIAPSVSAEEEFLNLTRSDENLLIISGDSGGGNVTLRSIYFGEDEPYFPNGADNYEISAEDVQSGAVDMNYFNVVTADQNGRYSARFRLDGYGYYLISAVSDGGRRESRLYNYRASSQDLEPPLSGKTVNSEPSKIFEIGGSKFILLDMGTHSSVLLPYSDLGISNGYMLEEYLETAVQILPQEMRGFVSGIYLPDSTFFEKYGGSFGIADGVGYFGNAIWSVLKSDIDNRDTSKYTAAAAEEEAGGLILGNIFFDAGKLYVNQNSSEAETIVEFIAPTDGSYTVKLSLSGEGSLKAQLTKLEKDKIFDNDLIAAAVYSGEELTKSESVYLSAGEKLYLHLYPSSGSVGLDYSIDSGSKVYNLSDFASAENKWWTAGGDGDAGYAYSMNSSDFGNVTSVSLDSELFVRPVIEVENTLFTSVKINVDSAGEEVFSNIRENFTREELGIYDEYELNTIFNEFGGFLFEVLPFTDGDGNVTEQISDGELNAELKAHNTTGVSKKITFILGVYSGENRLLNVGYTDIVLKAGEEGAFKVTTAVEGAGTGAYAKTFVWDSAEGMKPVSQTEPKDPVSSRLVDINAEAVGSWSFYVKPADSTDYSLYEKKTLTGTENVSTGSEIPNISWSFGNEGNLAYIRPEWTGEQVIEYIVPHKGNWKVEITWRNIGVGETLGGDGGSLTFSFLPKGTSNDIREFRSLLVNVSSENPILNSYDTTIAADGGDRIMLSADAGTDGYGDCWEIDYKISEVSEEGRVIGTDYENGLPVPVEEGGASSAGVKENTVWIGVDGSFGDSEAGKEKILYFKKFIPNMGVVLMSANPQDYCNAEFYEENGIPVIVQSYGAGFENYIEDNNAWEWDWNYTPLDSAHWQDLSGTAHAFSLPHYATKEVFSRLAKSAVTSGYSGYGYPDYVWMWGARGISGYNPETVEAFAEDLCGRDSGLRCNDGIWYFHDYYRYYTGSDTLITPEDLNLDSWEEYTPLSQEENAGLISAGVDTTAHWALFDMLCHYEWLKFAQYISDVAHDNGGICQIMINPEYYPDGVDYLFLNKLVNVDMTEDEFFGNTDYLDGAYYRFDYLTKYADNTKTGGVMEAGGGGNAGAYYTDEIAYLTAFELGALKSIDHLETDFMYQNSGFSAERDAQIMSYAMGFSAAKSLNLDKRPSDFVVISSRNQSRPWATDTGWKPWSLRIGYDGNIDFFLAKSGYNFDSISQEGIFDIENEDVVVFSPHRVTQSVWNDFLEKLTDGRIGTGIISAHRFDTAVTDKLKTVAFSQIAPDYSYSDLTPIGMSGHVTDTEGNTLTDSRKSLEGDLYTAMPGDETVLGFKTISKTYPLVVKRNVGNGEMYILLFDDSLSENYELTQFVYNHLLGLSQIKPMFESLENSGSLLTGFTETAAHTEAVEADLGASVRVYQNAEMTVAGVQNSLARVNAESSLTSTGQCAPYEISGSTTVKILMTPEESYKYIAIPSMAEGVVSADEQGYVTLSFDDTSHEIFFLLGEDSTEDFEEIKKMQQEWKTALEFSIE